MQRGNGTKNVSGGKFALGVIVGAGEGEVPGKGGGGLRGDEAGRKLGFGRSNAVTTQEKRPMHAIKKREKRARPLMPWLYERWNA